MNNYTGNMVLNGQVRITFIVAIILTTFLIAIISVSNSSLFAAAKGGLSQGGADTLDSPFSFISPNSLVSPVQAHSSDGGKTWSYDSYKPTTLTNDNLLNYVGNRNTKWDAVNLELGQFVDVGTGIRPASHDAKPVSNGLFPGDLSTAPVSTPRRLYVPLPFYVATTPSDSPLSYVSNSPSYGGGYIPVNLPRFDREAAYFRIVAPYQPIGLVPVKMDNPLLLNDGSVYSTGNNPYGQVSNIQGYPQASADCGEGTYRICVLDGQGIPVSYDAKPTYNQISQNEEAQRSQNLVTRHGGIVQVRDPIDTSSNIVIGTITVERTSFGDSELQNEEALFQENLKEAIIHRAL